ncbi:GYF domain-containing protein [Rubinisphaera margarita]|uniref:GYF domain-containing protein n=1 Tax=Rubinisphaera margarita TaxID=2909586 RepID=UPI001EE9A53D|nr:GYF domain-containing protein [Rubinisphaera margarita]MCG6155886.1 trypsin-like peptidase domain-containing protein [Rubinisphaera margarita]
MSSRGQFSKLHQVSEDGTSWQSAAELTAIFGERKQAAPQPEPEKATTESVEWHYVLDQQRLGPVKELELREHLRSGRIAATALVWHKGLPDWIEAREVFPEEVSEKRSLALPAALIALFVAAAAGATGFGVWYSQSQGAPDLARLMSPAGEIRSMDLANDTTQQQVRAATGMVVCYAEILQKTGERHERPFSTGTCFMVTRDGYAITNRHVVEDHKEWVDASEEGRVLRLADTIFDEASVTTDSSDEQDEFRGLIREVTAQTIGSIVPKINVYFGEVSRSATIEHISRKYDMAILKIEDPPTNQAYFALSAESVPPKSTQVIALGFPGTSRYAVTADEAALLASRATRSSLPEKLFGNDDHRTVFKSSAFDYVQTPGEVSVVQKEAGEIYNIQHTAAIRQGNSGGPLVFRSGPSAGTVIGINTLLLIHDAPVFIAFSVAQMRDELDRVIGPGKLTWR